MTSLDSNGFKVPYEMGRFIASQVPYLDSLPGNPWATHKGHFEVGPNPVFYQMKQGILFRSPKS